MFHSLQDFYSDVYPNKGNLITRKFFFKVYEARYFRFHPIEPTQSVSYPKGQDLRVDIDGCIQGTYLY